MHTNENFGDNTHDLGKNDVLAVLGEAETGKVSEECEMQGQEPIEEMPKKKKLFSTTNYMQLSAHTLYYIISVFVTTFLVSHIYSISDNYMVSIGLFYVGNYLAMGIFYLLFSLIIDRTNRVVFYRIALIIKAIFIFMLIFWGEKLASLVFAAGALYGFSEACYWMSYNLMKNELVRKSSTRTYSMLQSCLEKFINIVVPVTLGKIIDSNSFKTSSIIMAVVVIIQLIFSMFIKSKRPEGSSFSFKELQNAMKTMGERGKLIKYMLIFSFVYGFTSCISQIETIVIMIGFNSNLSLGVVTSIGAAISILFILLINKLTPGKRDWIYFLNMMPLIAAIICSIIFNNITITIFALLYKVLQHSYTVTFDASRNILLKKLNLYGSIAEFQCAIECILATTRVISYAIMAVLGWIGASFGTTGLFVTAKVFLIISVVAMSVTSISYMFLEKKLVKEKIV